MNMWTDRYSIMIDSIYMDYYTNAYLMTDYNGIGKLQYLFGQKQIPLMDAEYTDKVHFAVLVPVSRVQEITKAVTEATSGQAVIEEEGSLYYAVVDGEYLCFP